MAKPCLLRQPTTWFRLILAVSFLVFTLVLMYLVFNTRYQFYGDGHLYRCLPVRFAVVDKWDKDVNLGDIYAFKAKNTMIYKDGTLLAKKFMATFLDTVAIEPDEYLYINGKQEAYGLKSATKLKLDKKRFVGKRILEKDEYFALGTTINSFDSRYFGTVYEDQIIGKLYPIF